MRAVCIHQHDCAFYLAMVGNQSTSSGHAPVRTFYLRLLAWRSYGSAGVFYFRSCFPARRLNPGTFGDMFGGLNTLFTGCALHRY